MGKQLIINCEQLENRVALVNDGSLEQYEIERTDQKNLVGSIYIGRIVSHEPSLQASFVEIGERPKQAFLHYWDMLPASYDMIDRVHKEKQEETPKKGRSFAEKLRKLLKKSDQNDLIQRLEQKRENITLTKKDVPDLFPKGSEILVQVTKGPIGTKGPRVSTNIAIAGRYLVLLPYSDHLGLSKKIDDKKERQRLSKILGELDVPDGLGIILRTVGEGRKSSFFKRDLDMLLGIWHDVETKIRKPKVPSCVYASPNLLERTVFDFITDDINEIHIDNRESRDFLKGKVDRFLGDKAADQVRLYQKARPIFEHFKIERQIENIFKREVPLPGGGYICVDETEALVAIDVNTGKNKEHKDQPETILATNKEACEEVSRQLRLRNVGGLVVVDLIDMRPARHRDEVLKHMRKFCRSDRAKMKILPISRLGLMEMTRQRERESLKATMYDRCPYCSGSGRVKSATSMSVEIQRRLREVLKRRRDRDASVRVLMHPTILARLKNEDAGLLIDLEERYGHNLSFRADPSMHLEEFKLVDPDRGSTL